MFSGRRSGGAESDGRSSAAGSLRASLLEEKPGDSSREDAEGWVFTYMDLITLLLTLFILLLSYSSKQSGEYEELTSAMAEATNAPSVIEFPAEPPPPPPNPLELMQQTLQQQFEEGGVGNEIGLVASNGTLTIQLSEQLMFPSGEAEFSDNAEAVLQQLIDVLRDETYLVTVEGHTDNIPINTERFPSNWELSAARAISVVRYFIDEGIRPERLRAIGYASTRPIADNSSSEGRMTNRRVTLSISENGTEAE